MLDVIDVDLPVRVEPRLAQLPFVCRKLLPSLAALFNMSRVTVRVSP